MKIKYILFAFLNMLTACENNESVPQPDTAESQLQTLNSLLRDSNFAVALARHQDSAYNVSVGNPEAPEAWRDSTILKKVSDQKIAVNLAGFLATECAVGALMELHGGTPVAWLQRIVNNNLDSNQKLLTNRFANATWKASQPFRDMARITRDNFIVANFLSESEVQKDFDQVRAAAKTMMDTLLTFNDTTAVAETRVIATLMQDKDFARRMAAGMETAYNKGQKQKVPVFLAPGEDTATVMKSLFEEKVAINLAAFYALECGTSYFVQKNHTTPSNVLTSILKDSLPEADKRIFERFANATWKAGQAFRDLSRIERDNFIPFDLLSEEEKEKDWNQIKWAASLVSPKIKGLK